MNIPHISCEEAAVNVEKTFWQKLKFVDWVKTRWHMFLCEKCRDYEKDSKALHRILCSMKSKEKTPSLNQEEKDKIKKALG